MFGFWTKVSILLIRGAEHEQIHTCPLRVRLSNLPEN